MQTIQLKKFGNVLVSRPMGLEAFQAIRPQLNPDIPIQIDFSEVLTITPSWFDEFLTQLVDFNKGKVELLPTTNPSVLAVLPVLATARKDLVADVIKRFLK
ncbi:MAG: hypothetical protein ACD_43C00225G0001 [uncultured bacterium]|nr:MAG: hypothetical protein ACD_43C00225G0001 [uncultured bacterium]